MGSHPTQRSMDSSHTSEKSKFWTLCQLVPGSEGLGYQNRSQAIAQNFFRQIFQPQFPQLSDSQTHSTTLLKIFRDTHVGAIKTQQESAHAGLCLRCWVSHPILKACIKLANLFSSTGQFSYRELLPFVLTDDGRQLVVPTSDGNGYQIISNDQEVYPSFSLEVLRTYRLTESKTSLSLTNWVFLQVKQHPELTCFLAEFGFQRLSDWALLNRVRVSQMEQLSASDQTLVEAFHAVYRRDRRLNASTGRCSPPNTEQLCEMRALLNSQPFPDDQSVLQALKQVVTQLRQYDIWRSRESLEQFNPETGAYQTRTDLPSTHIETDDFEASEMVQHLHQQLSEALHTSLEQVLTDRIEKLKKRKKYASFANKVVIGLQYYYRDRISLREMPPLLGMSSNDQARRILDPGGLLNQVRALTLTQLLSHN